VPFLSCCIGLKLGYLDECKSIDVILEKNEKVFNFGAFVESDLHPRSSSTDNASGNHNTHNTAEEGTKNPVWAKDLR
jgi:hypothetical protein